MITHLAYKVSSILVALGMSVFFIPAHAQLASLEPVYNLGGAVSQPVPGTAGSLVSITGTVTSVDTFSPDSVQIRFLYQKSDGTGQMYQDTFITPAPDGSFVSTVGTVNPLTCGEEYNFYLYEFPDLLIQYTSQNSQTPNDAFSLTIDCFIPPQQGDLYPMNGFQPTWIAGVNWGDVIDNPQTQVDESEGMITDSTITINGAHLIPVLPHGIRSFRLEIGEGSPGDADLGVGSVGLSDPIIVSHVLAPPYNFSRQIIGLSPGRSYYFNIFELGNISGQAVEHDLRVYGFATTKTIDADEVNYNFTAGNTGVRVYGHLTNSSGVALMNTDIRVLIAPSVNGTPDIASAYESSVTTGGNSFINGNGFFEANLGPVSQGASYFILIKYQDNGNDIINPIPITVPTSNNSGGGNGGNGDGDGDGDSGPSYNGLVACSGVDCDFNSLIATVNRVIDFLIKYIAFPLVAIVIAWAGIKLLISGGSSEAKSSAKSMIGKVVIGLIIALLSWVIIKLILVTLGYVPGGPLWCLFNITPQCPA
jgi:hypothetical protein